QTEFPNTFVGNCYFQDMAAAYSAARIVFNRSLANDVNMRVFEALCSGSLLITNDLSDNGLADLFEDGTHLVTYGNAAELLDRVRWHLEHEQEREQIAAAGRCEVLARHTYRHRMETLLQAAAQSITKPSPRPGRPVAKPDKETTYFEFDRPEVLALVPVAAKRVLDIGCGAGRLGLSIKQRQEAHVSGIELNDEAAELARQRLDQVIVGDLEQDEIDFALQSLDCVVCADVLEHLRRPRIVLDRIARWLAPDGCLVASIPNVRHHSVIQSLLDGNFTYEPAGLLDEDHARLFTRREIEKLFFRAGFTITGIEVVPGPGHREWELRGRPGEVAAGRLRIGGLTPAEAEEFYAYQYLVTAIPAGTPTSVLADELPPSRSNLNQAPQLQSLFDAFPWPETKPDVSVPTEHAGWMADGARQQLESVLHSDTQVVVELGAWLGLSTRFIADTAPQAAVISIDHWLGSPEHQGKAEYQELLPVLYETFLTMCWDYRHRIVPLRMSTQEGLQRIAEAGIQPDVIYFDAEHSFEAVTAGMTACQKHFPQATLIGDDYDEPSVARAVSEFASREGFTVEAAGQAWRGWRLVPRPKNLLPVRVIAGDQLTSIILVTHNQLDYTRACLQSIRFVTDEPYELIVVDNGSTDGTVEYLKSQTDVTLLENPENRGFPAAVNKGILAARGQHLLLLNNDTIVTTGWLCRMLAALHSADKVGLVGPCSNSVSGPQQVPVSYTDLNGLDGFAWEWGKTHHQRTTAVDRLVGFCLLFKRKVTDKIGLLDERFGIGNFEDDDYCRRAIAAGFQCLIAREAFIHHFGGTTFRASGLDFHALLDENRRKYAEKWGDGQPLDQLAATVDREASLVESPNNPTHQNPDDAANRDAANLIIRIGSDGDLLLETTSAKNGAATSSPAAPARPRLSLCMIVRDNEPTLRACLESIRPWVDEMIVVDTGSTDATPQIAAEL
ncbi:MAG: glycosyltransferase, partial [Pirellulaceae bacterium]